mmetsp:Transcript_96255/g.176248  ORF Transcript_96255/g.176248 Transcript_96255/m.176248 type:complete len:349 (-) Transcript_96255:2899-3945(-)
MQSQTESARAASLSFLELQEEVTRGQNVALLLLGAALAWERLDHQAINLRWHGDLHLHLHGLQHDQRLAFLQQITLLHVVHQDLTRHDACKLVLVTWVSLARAGVGLRSGRSVRVRHGGLHTCSLKLEAHLNIAICRFSEALELNLLLLHASRVENLELGASWECARLGMQHLWGNKEWGEVGASCDGLGEIETLLLISESVVDLGGCEALWEVFHADNACLCSQSSFQLACHILEEHVHVRCLLHKCLPTTQAHEHISTHLELSALLNPSSNRIGGLWLNAVFNHDADAKAELVFAERCDCTLKRENLGCHLFGMIDQTRVDRELLADADVGALSAACPVRVPGCHL